MTETEFYEIYLYSKYNFVFRIVKVYKNVEVEVAELAMVTMEAFGKGMAVDKLCKAASEKTSLQVC